MMEIENKIPESAEVIVPVTNVVVSSNTALQSAKKTRQELSISDSNSSTQIRDLFLKEVKSMTRYTMSSGIKDLPDHIYPIIEVFSLEYEAREKEKQRLKESYVFNPSEALDLTQLVAVHDLLSSAIAPATPRAVLLLDLAFAEKTALSWISPVPLLRYLMLVAFFSLFGFILVSLSPYISEKGGDIFHADGLVLLTNLMFFVFSASLGACFAALFQANNYIMCGVFDPKYAPSYWIRLLVGIMAGLILASLIPVDPKALNGLGKPTLALIGGFSASLVYRILNLLVGIIEDMVKRMSTAMLGQDKTS
jgi:hypothetical protein